MLSQFSHTATFAGHGGVPSPVVSAPPEPPALVLHKLRAIRIRERVSLRTMGRRLKLTQAEVKRLEDEADPRLSTLHAWAEALEVPTAELVGDPPAAVAEHLLWRAKMVQFMKIVRTIEDWAKHSRIRRLASFLAEQMLSMMPELHGIGPLPATSSVRGPRPSCREERPVPTNGISVMVEESQART